MKSLRGSSLLILTLICFYFSFTAGGYLQSIENRNQIKDTNTTGATSKPAQKETVYFTLENSNHIPTNAPYKIENKLDSPVLSRGKSGEWDSVDLLNPSVIKKGDTYYNYYSGYDGKVWRTGLATSKDGLNWIKYNENPILDISPNSWDSSYIAANGSAIYFNNQFLYFYHGQPRSGGSAIGVALSDDGKNFKKNENPILTGGETHSWDANGVADPYVIEHNGFLYMYYLGMDEMFTQRLGIARSKDGIAWERIQYPIMDVGSKGTFDENGLGEPSVIYNAPYFYMLYTGRAADEKRDIGLAISLDGVNWRKLNATGIFNDRKSNNWDSEVICDTTLLLDKEKGIINVWYGGGNLPEPAQNLNGNVGLFQLNINQNRDLSFFDPNKYNSKEVDSKDVIKGSYDIEGEDGKKIVWLSKESSISLLENKNKEIYIKGYVPFSLHKKSNEQLDSLEISVYINSKEVHKEKINEDRSFEISIDQSKLKELVGNNDFINVQIKTSNDFIPFKIGQGKDQRNLSVILNYIGYR